MNLKIYLKNSISKIIYFIILFFIINAILITSTNISKSLYDILYMNLLILAASLCFLGFEYHKWKNNYKDFKTALDNNEKLEHIILNNNIFESQLIKDTIRLKNNEFYKKVRELQTSLEEINDYTTQWVHEIKIPISVCELISDKLAEAVTLEDIGKASEDMKMELERIKFLIDQILYASRSSVYSEDFLMSPASP